MGSDGEEGKHLGEWGMKTTGKKGRGMMGRGKCDDGNGDEVMGRNGSKMKG